MSQIVTEFIINLSATENNPVQTNEMVYLNQKSEICSDFFQLMSYGSEPQSHYSMTHVYLEVEYNQPQKRNSSISFFFFEQLIIDTLH